MTGRSETGAEGPADVLVYVQHLLGIGHLRRAAIIAKALDRAGLDTLFMIIVNPMVWNIADAVNLSLQRVMNRFLNWNGSKKSPRQTVSPIWNGARPKKWQRLNPLFFASVPYGRPPQVLSTAMG